MIAVSDYLRRELELKLPEARGKTEVVDSGVDLDAVRRSPRADRRSSGRPIVAVGSLTERKNVVRLADAFATLGRGTPHLRRRRAAARAARGPGARAGRRPRSRTTRSPATSPPPTSSVRRHWSSRSASRSSRRWRPGRTVVATRVGGPPEFVPPEAGILVDPLDEGALARALDGRGRLPVAERGGARRPPPRTTSGVRRSGWRRCCERASRDRRA